MTYFARSLAWLSIKLRGAFSVLIGFSHRGLSSISGDRFDAFALRQFSLNDINDYRITSEDAIDICISFR